MASNTGVGIITTRVFPATFFDYNGVLVDDEAVHCAAMLAAVRPLGITFSERDYWERYLGFDDIGAFQAILHDAGRSPRSEVVNELVETKARLYLEAARDQLETFDGAGALVRRLAQAGPVAVVSGALRHEIELGLEVLGVTQSICCIVAAEDTTASKPDPEGYEIAKRRLRELGHPRSADRALVHRAISRSALDGDVEALPDGVETLVGERGIMLSGGQRQRVALARALYRKGDVLILDDVLSAVDHTTETQLVRTVAELAGGDHPPTTFIASHRMSALRHCDMVLVLDRGRLVDSGTHSELLRRPGIYRDTWMIQSQRATAASEAAS